MSAIINTLIFSIIVQKPKSVNTFLYKLLLWLLFLPIIGTVFFLNLPKLPLYAVAVAKRLWYKMKRIIQMP